MNRIAAVLPLLAATPAFAQTADASMEAAGPLAMVLFAAVFFGACAWFAWLTWRNEKKDRDSKKVSG